MAMDTSQQTSEFESVKNRLAEIADAVDDENLSLDDALDLYEEAVSLGLQASDLLETGIVVPEEEAEGAAGGAGAPEAAEQAEQVGQAEQAEVGSPERAGGEA